MLSEIQCSRLRSAGDTIKGGESLIDNGDDRSVMSRQELDRHVERAISVAKRGDQEGIRFLYIRYFDSVNGYVRRIVRDDYEAEDITQQVFVKLMTAVHKYQPWGVPFKGWILRLAHNVAIDHLRVRAPIPVDKLPFHDYRDDSARRDSLRLLEEALKTLPEDQRTVVVLRHFLGLSPPEIASRVGRTESAVHGLQHRGRRNLQIQLSRLDVEPQTRHLRH